MPTDLRLTENKWTHVVVNKNDKIGVMMLGDEVVLKRFKSEAAANKWWNFYKKNNPKMLDGLELRKIR